MLNLPENSLSGSTPSSAHMSRKACRDVFILLFQTLDISCIEVSATVQSHKLAAEHVNVGIILDDGPVAVDCHGVHHDFTPLTLSG